jgi:LAO/AO transport system kinase
MEIADVFVVNKADRPGAGFIARDLESEVELEARENRWKVPVLLSSAVKGEGVDAILDAVDRHLAWCMGEGRSYWDQRRAAGRVRTCLDLVAETARKNARTRLLTEDKSTYQALLDGRIKPLVAANELGRR